jgi:glycosyltransferase involved in cell wall biosynthesis
VDEDTKQHLLSCCSLLCVPSSDESFGIVYVEAMSYGKPVVALDIYPVKRNNREWQNRNSGLPKSRKSSPALKKLLTNETLRKEMGKAARHCFESRYSNEKVIGRYKELYSAAAK